MGRLGRVWRYFRELVIQYCFNKRQKLRLNKMNSVNPKYVLRNHIAWSCIQEANKGNYVPL